MGSIRNIVGGSNVHLLLTSSNLAELYVYDELKRKCRGCVDSIYVVDSKSSVANMLDLVNVQSFISDKWLFILDYSKVKSVLKTHRGIFDCDTSEFLIKVKNYREFKEVKGILGSINDIYLSFIRFDDIAYLLRDCGLSDSLVRFIASSYSSDPEQVFVLRKEILEGRIISSKREVVELCGVSVGSLNSFVLLLLRGISDSDRGRKMVYRNRLKVAVELAEVYGYGKMRNFMVACVRDILDIKQLYMVGAIYDKIAGIPDVEVLSASGGKVSVFDEKRLARYSRYLDVIRDTPYSRVLNLYLVLKDCGVWRNSTDMVNFLYNYYEGGV